MACTKLLIQLNRFCDANSFAGSVQGLDEIDTLCGTIASSARRRKKLQLTFESHGLWQPENKEEPSATGMESRKHSSLQQLLGLPQFKFSKASKRRLLVNLARALLLLFDTSWWTGRNIVEKLLIEHDQKSMEYPRQQTPYIHRQFNCLPGSDKADEPVYGNYHPIFLEYALLLLQFETGKKPEPTEDDLDLFTGEISPYLMLTRLLDEAREEVSIKCCRIGEACLEFDSHLRRFAVQRPDFTDSMKIRAVIYRQLFKPVLEVIKDDFPVEADGLDLPDWPDIVRPHMEPVQIINRTRPTSQTDVPERAPRLNARNHDALIPSRLRVVSTHLGPNLLLFDVDTAYHAER